MKSHDSRRREVIVALAALPFAARAGETATIEVWKNAGCGCCKEWIKHLEANGFRVTASDVNDLPERRKQAGMPERYASCHVARVTSAGRSYTVEGHVPATDIKRLLATRPIAVGLAVPGMPIGSPGMELGPRLDPYDVLLVRGDGSTQVFSSYGKGPKQ